MSNQPETIEAPSCSLTGRSEALAFIQEVEVCLPSGDISPLSLDPEVG